MSSTQRMRRAVASSLALLGAGALLVGCASGGGAPKADLGSGPAKAGTVKEGALQGSTVTFVSWGGVFQKGQMDAAGKPFAKASGATVLEDGPTEYAKVKAQVDNNAVTWDVVDTDIIWAQKQCGDKGLLMPLDKKIVDTSKVPDGLVGDCYVPAMQYGYVILYNAKKYPTAPTGWKDFFDTQKFPGKRAIAGFEDVGPGIYEGALLADGVAPDKLYPLDMDRAYKSIDGIRSSLIYWKTGAESQQMIESGEADMALVWSGRGYAAVKNGADYKPIWNQALQITEALGVPKNAKNPDAAFAFINYYLGKEQQEKLTELTSYSPVNTEAEPKLDALGEEYLTHGAEIAKQMVPTDAKWWAENYDSELERWTKWLQADRFTVTTTNIPVVRAANTSRRAPVRALLLLLPAYALLLGVFAYPVFESMWRSVSDPQPGLDNYVWAFENSQNIGILLRTFGNAALATVICLLLAYPYAFLMTVVGPRARAWLVVIALIPFWTSLMIRTFAWIVLLQDSGVVNSFLELLNLGPVKLLRSNTGVLIGLSQVLMPFMVLPLYAVMNGIDGRLVTAARSLGARPSVAFLRVFLPLSLPGIAAGALMVFIQALGFYVTPALLGSPSDSMLAQAIYAQVSSLLQWGRGGALGVILLVSTFVLLGLVGLVARGAKKRGLAVEVFS